MNKFILPFMLVAVFLAISTVDARKPNLPPEREIDWADELDLSKTQQAQVKEIYDQSHEKIKSLMQQIDTLHHEIANMRDADDAKIRELLTEKQQIKFDKIKVRMQKEKPDFDDRDDGKKPSRKRMRQYGGLDLQS